MFKKIDHIIVFVKDMGRATSFYRDVLGFKVNMESPDFTMVQLGDIWLGLHTTEAEGIDIGHGPIIYLAVEDVEKAQSYFKEKNVTLGNSQSVPSGKITTFYDSEGNTLGVYQGL